MNTIYGVPVADSSGISLYSEGDPSPPQDVEYIVNRPTIGSARRSHVPDDSRIHYQRCGGGRRILKKRIGGE